MYAKPGCPVCLEARRLLESEGASVTQIVISGESVVVTEVSDQSNRQGPPQIFIGKTHVGGLGSLKRLEASGKARQATCESVVVKTQLSRVSSSVASRSAPLLTGADGKADVASSLSVGHRIGLGLCSLRLRGRCGLAAAYEPIGKRERDRGD